LSKLYFVTIPKFGKAGALFRCRVGKRLSLFSFELSNYVFCVLKTDLHVCENKQKNHFDKKRNLAVGVIKEAVKITDRA
jgi:hypothetical protein